jgi:hypothetical protein
MQPSHARRVKFPARIPGTIESRAAMLLHLLSAYPDNDRYVGWAFGQCRRCRLPLYSVRSSHEDDLLMLFCKSCFWYCFDEDSRVWKRAVSNAHLRPADSGASPARPLERMINSHLNSLRIE